MPSVIAARSASDRQRDAVGLEPRKDRSADVLGGSLELCSCVDGRRQLIRAENREPRAVFGSHGHGRYLTVWFNFRNYSVLLRTLIRSKDAWPYAIRRVSDKASDARRLPNGSLTAEHENDR